MNGSKTVGHEITHVLEGTELYSELQAAVKAYAERKGEYQSRYDALTELYKGQGADIEAELTANLVGDYLFTDEKFIMNLSTEQPNIFKKIYDEIKYLVKIATAGSKESKQLEQVKRAFDKAYKENKLSVKDTNRRYDIDYEQLDDFLNQVDENKGQTNYKYNQYPFSVVPDVVAEMIYKATDGRVSAKNKRFAFEGGKLSHEFISHGNEKVEASKGQKSYSLEDVDKIIDTMMEPDIVEDISSGDKLDQRNSVAFAKEIDGEMIVVAAIGGKNNPNIVPEQILWFTKQKWKNVVNGDKTLREIIYKNNSKRGKITSDESEKIKKNRVTVAHGESKDSSARYVQDVPHSPLDSIIPSTEENASGKQQFSFSEDNHKQKQLDIILKTNPAENIYSTWVRTTEDILTFEEALNSDDYIDYKGEDFDESYPYSIAEEALETGKITVYSSYPIEQGIFVTPSYMEAQMYAGNGKVCWVNIHTIRIQRLHLTK